MLGTDDSNDGGKRKRKQKNSESSEPTEPTDSHGEVYEPLDPSVAAAPANFWLEPEPEPATMRAEPSHRVEAATLAEPSRASFGHVKPAEPA